MRFLDRPEIDPDDPDGRELLEALKAVYYHRSAVQPIVQRSGLPLANFSWEKPMSEVWPDVLREAAACGRLRGLVQAVANQGRATAYEVFGRLAAEAKEAILEAPGERELEDDAGPCPGIPTEQPGDQREGRPSGDAISPAADLCGLGDDQARALQDCATVLKDLVATTEAAERTSTLTPEFADVYTRMQLHLGRAKTELLAVNRMVGLTTWPDAAWAAKFSTARDSALRDAEAAEGVYGLHDRTGHVLRSASALLTLLKERYPSLFMTQE